MPQENYVLKCYSCEMFQVHIVKKAKKWECKVCSVKQSFIGDYGRGDAKDCRLQVMKLSELQRQNESDKIQNFCQYFDKNDGNNPKETETVNSTKKSEKLSKWMKYLDPEDFESADEEDNGAPSTLINDQNTKEHQRDNYLEEETISHINSDENKTESRDTSFNFNKCELVKISSNAETDLFFQTEKPNKKIVFLTKKRKLNEVGENIKLEKTGIKSIINQPNIFSSDPKDLDDIINISF